MVRRYEVRDGVARALDLDEPAASQTKRFSETRNAPSQHVTLLLRQQYGLSSGWLASKD